MTRAVITAFHNYTPQGDHKYFNVISDYYLSNFNKYWRDEVDHLYLLDSNWDFPPIDDPKITVIKTNPNIRYFDAYKQVLPDIKEDLVGFLDNDTAVFQSGVIADAFSKIDVDYETYEEPKYDVVSVFDTIGTFQTDKMGGKNKLCPYWFFARKELLMKYLDVNWGDAMPEHETLGKLTEVMLNDGLRFCEAPEDKATNGEQFGFSHIRAGSETAYLLSTKHFGNTETYWSYIKNQPVSETLRHCVWYFRMGGDSSEIREDILKKQ